LKDRGSRIFPRPTLSTNKNAKRGERYKFPEKGRGKTTPEGHTNDLAYEARSSGARRDIGRSDRKEKEKVAGVAD